MPDAAVMIDIVNCSLFERGDDGGGGLGGSIIMLICCCCDRFRRISFVQYMMNEWMMNSSYVILSIGLGFTTLTHYITFIM